MSTAAAADALRPPLALPPPLSMDQAERKGEERGGGLKGCKLAAAASAADSEDKSSAAASNNLERLNEEEGGISMGGGKWPPEK